MQSVRFVVLVAVLCASDAHGEEPKLTKAEIAKRAKPATAFVIAKLEGRPVRGGLTSQGSAFCVHESGLFVTNEHVVRGATEIELVVNPSEQNQEVYRATVIRRAEADDLALLRVENPKDLAVLALGNDAALSELSEVVACGYPFGSALAFGTKDYPSVTATAGAVSSLRKKDGQLELIQLDVNLNPGNSGGPVLDSSGKAVGVVLGGIRGTQLNFAIPVRRVAALLAQPELTFVAPTVRATDRGKPVVIEARVASFDGAKDPEVELEVRRAGAVTRYPLKSEKGAWRAEVVLLPADGAAPKLGLEVSFADGSLTASTKGARVKVGGTEYGFDQLRSLSPSKKEAVLRTGERVTGDIAGLGAVPVALGGKEVALDLSAAQEIALLLTSEVPVLTLDVVARRGGKELARVARTVLLDEANKVYLADLEPFATRPGPWPLAVGKNGSTENNLPIKVNGTLHPRALGLHSNNPAATATWRLGKKATVFRTGVAFGDCNDGKVTGPHHFEVYGDDKLLWKSKAITTRYQLDECVVDVTGVDKLELRVGHTDRNYGGHGVWIDPILIGPDPAAIRRASSVK